MNSSSCLFENSANHHTSVCSCGEPLKCPFCRCDNRVGVEEANPLPDAQMICRFDSLAEPVCMYVGESAAALGTCANYGKL